MCSTCDWEDFLDQLGAALEDEAFEWAADTLEGISDTVVERGHATDRQKEAFGNISDAVGRRRR